MRVLILADDCNPYWPSLPLFIYQHILKIAELVDVDVATQVRNKKNIEEVGLGRAHITYINNEKIAAPLFKLGLKIRRNKLLDWSINHALSYPAYLSFEWLAFKHFKKELLQKKIDIVHRISPVKSTIPSYMAQRCSMPFLIGPLTEALPWPKKFRSIQKQELTFLNNFFAELLNCYKFLPYYKSTYKFASAVLASFDHTIDNLPRSIINKIINFPEVGFDPHLFKFSKKGESKQMTILFVGRLVPFKRADILIHAFQKSITLQKHKLVVVGDGPELRRLQNMVNLFELDRSIQFTGGISHKRVSEIMQKANIFAFPSVHELTGGAVVEAMACGLACLAVDYGGPSHIIHKNFGVKVPLVDEKQLIKEFKRELEWMVTNPVSVKQMGKNASKHAYKYYSWEAKAKKTVEIYNWLLKYPKKEKPFYWD